MRETPEGRPPELVVLAGIDTLPSVGRGKGRKTVVGEVKVPRVRETF